MLSDLHSTQSACDVAGRDLQTPDPTRVSARAGRTTPMGLRAGSTETSDGGCSFPSNSNLAITTYRHLGAMVIFSPALISQVLHCVVALMGRGLAGNCSSLCRAFRGLGRGLCPSLPILKTVSAVRPWCFSLQARGVTLTSPKSFCCTLNQSRHRTLLRSLCLICLLLQ